MANIEHSTLTGDEQHEPKGVDTATVNHTYVSDGAGSGTWKAPVLGGQAESTVDQVYVADGAGGGTWKTAWSHGIEDHNDVTTTGTPIALTVANTAYPLTNDGAGSFTNLTYALPSSTPMWNVSTNQFEFNTAGLVLGDTVLFRIDIDIVNSGANGSFNIAMDLGIGSAGPYTLEVAREEFRYSGTFNMTAMFYVYMGDTNTLNFPARFTASSDTTGDSLIVNGWVAQHNLQNPRYV
tara:strand:+ start:14796 stop:15506 length:711 start_codon:yes stop_codon:yes gene_type:complete